MTAASSPIGIAAVISSPKIARLRAHKNTMHHSKLFGSKIALVIALSCLFAGAVPAATIDVPADQPTIQQAIDVANTGDVVLVSPWSYLENIDYHGKAISVRSVSGPAHTIIDGSSAGPVATFQTGEGTHSTLSGFTIQHGFPSLSTPIKAGLTFATSSAINPRARVRAYWCHTAAKRRTAPSMFSSSLNTG